MGVSTTGFAFCFLLFFLVRGGRRQGEITLFHNNCGCCITAAVVGDFFLCVAEA